MTTRAPGLTAGMRWLDAKGREWEIFEKLPFGLNLCRTTDRRFQGEWTTRDIRKAITALAAPRMTAAELEWMERIGVEALIPTGILPKVVQGLFDKGWIQQYAGMWLQFTPAGLTALNNMRAAMGSAEYKEQP